MTKIQGIYSITHKESGRTYIGSSKNVKKRLGAHCTDLKNNKHPNPVLQNYYNKYGADSLEFNVLFSVFDIVHLIDAENEFIAQVNNSAVFDTLDFEKLFNTQWANKTGCVDPTKYKKGPAHHLYGKPSPKKGKTFSEEVRANMSAGQKGKRYTTKISISDDHKSNISAGKKGIPWSQARWDAYNKRILEKIT